MSTLMHSHGRPVALDGAGIAVLPVADTVVFVSADGWLGWGQGTPGAITPNGVLCAAVTSTDAIALGTDAGEVLLAHADGSTRTLASLGARWIEQIAAAPKGPLIAVSSGREAWVVGGDGRLSGPLKHPSGVTGLVFEAKGKRMAAAHVDGVSLWWAANPQVEPTSLAWKGSHIGVTWSPDGRFVVTAQQDMTLHGWRLEDKADMRMAGYPAKTRAMTWTPKGRFLATSGAAPVVCWPFHSKDGPMGKAPLELPPHGPVLTSTVACHPKRDVVAAGYQDGTVTLFRLEDLADLPVADATGHKVTALSFSRDGRTLGFLRADGSGGLLTLPL